MSEYLNNFDYHCVTSEQKTTSIGNLIANNCCFLPLSNVLTNQSIYHIQYSSKSVINMEYSDGNRVDFQMFTNYKQNAREEEFFSYMHCSATSDDMKMDVDTTLDENLPNQLVEPMDIDESFKSQTQPIEDTKETSVKENTNTGKLSYLTVFLSFLIPIILAYFLGLQIDKKTDLTTLPKDLTTLFNHSFETDIRTNLFGQENVINNLNITFTDLNTSYTIYLVGNAGVGKTLTASIVSKHFIYQQNIFKIIGIVHWELNDQFELLSRLSRSSFNLIIFDNLKYDDLDRVNGFLNHSKFKMYQTVVLVVVTTDLEINLEFVPDKSTVIYFNDLAEDDLKQCVISSLRRRDLVVTEERIQEVLMHLNADGMGCKRIDSKVGVLGKNDDMS